MTRFRLLAHFCDRPVEDTTHLYGDIMMDRVSDICMARSPGAEGTPVMLFLKYGSKISYLILNPERNGQWIWTALLQGRMLTPTTPRDFHASGADSCFALRRKEEQVRPDL